MLTFRTATPCSLTNKPGATLENALLMRLNETLGRSSAEATGPTKDLKPGNVTIVPGGQPCGGRTGFTFVLEASLQHNTMPVESTPLITLGFKLQRTITEESSNSSLVQKLRMPAIIVRSSVPFSAI